MKLADCQFTTKKGGPISPEKNILVYISEPIELFTAFDYIVLKEPVPHGYKPAVLGHLALSPFNVEIYHFAVTQEDASIRKFP